MKFIHFKSKDWRLIKNFSAYFIPHKKWIVFSIFSIPVTTAAGLVFLWLIQKIIDNYIVPKEIRSMLF